MKPSEHLTVRGPEDILGFIPHSLGYWPADSLVAMTLQGNRLGATLRLDLPGPEILADPRDYACTVRDYLRSDKLADSALLACFTDHGWMEPPGTYAVLLGSLQTVLGAAGMPVRDAWYVGTAYWRDAFCADESCCPAPGRPVQVIRDSMLNAEMIFRGSSVGPAPEDGALPPAMPPGEDRAATLAAEAGWSARLDPRSRSREQFCQLLLRWEDLLASCSGQPLSVNDTAFLRASLRVPAWRDAVLVMAAAGRLAAVEGAASFGIFDPACKLPPVGPAYPRPVLPGSEAPEPPPFGDGPGSPDGEGGADVPGYGEVLLGLEPVVPAWHRLNNLDRMLEQLTACGGKAGAAALTGRGWIAWCRGRGSYAAAYLGQALEEEPGYRLAELMLDLVRHGTLCGWAARKEAAWRTFEPDAA